MSHNQIGTLTHSLTTKYVKSHAFKQTANSSHHSNKDYLECYLSF